MWRKKVSPLFFKYIPPEKLDTINHKNPIEIACDICKPTLVKKYKALGFTWKKEKEKALSLAFNDRPECYKMMEYYVELGADINSYRSYSKNTFLCIAVKLIFRTLFFKIAFE